MSAGTVKDRPQTQSGSGKGKEKNSKSDAALTMDPEVQQRLEEEMRASTEQRSETKERMDVLEAQIEEMPTTIATAVATAMAEQQRIATEAFTERLKAVGERNEEAFSANASKLVEALKMEDPTAKERVQEAVEDTRNFVVKAASGTWNVLKPRRPHREDIAPVLYGNIATWGGTYLLAQFVPGVGDFIADIYSSGGDLA